MAYLCLGGPGAECSNWKQFWASSDLCPLARPTPQGSTASPDSTCSNMSREPMEHLSHSDLALI